MVYICIALLFIIRVESHTVIQIMSNLSAPASFSACPSAGPSADPFEALFGSVPLSTASLNMFEPRITTLPFAWKEKVDVWAADLVSWTTGHGVNVNVHKYVQYLLKEISSNLDELEKYRVSTIPIFSLQEREVICCFVASAVYDADVAAGMDMFDIPGPESHLSDIREIYDFYESTFSSLGGDYVFLCHSRVHVLAYVCPI